MQNASRTPGLPIELLVAHSSLRLAGTLDLPEADLESHASIELDDGASIGEGRNLLLGASSGLADVKVEAVLVHPLLIATIAQSEQIRELDFGTDTEPPVATVEEPQVRAELPDFVRNLGHACYSAQCLEGWWLKGMAMATATHELKRVPGYETRRNACR